MFKQKKDLQMFGLKLKYMSNLSENVYKITSKGLTLSARAPSLYIGI